jgi:hypothetical protein
MGLYTETYVSQSGVGAIALPPQSKFAPYGSAIPISQ